MFSGCITFVFCTIVELAFVCFITRCFGGNLTKKLTRKRRQRRKRRIDDPQQLCFQSLSPSLDGMCNRIISSRNKSSSDEY